MKSATQLPLFRTGPAKAASSGPCSFGFDQPLSLETPQLFLAASSSVCSYNIQVFFSHVETEFIIFQFVAITSCSVAGCGTTEYFFLST